MKPFPLLFTLATLLPYGMVVQAQTPTQVQTQTPVARLSYISGAVDWRSNSKVAAKPVQNNAPLVARNILNTNARARSEFRIGNTLVRLDAESELEISQLDAKQVTLNLHYGSVYLQAASGALELRSAQGSVRLQDGAQLRMDAVTQPDATAIRLFSGNAQFTANGAAPYELQVGTQFSLRGQGSNTASINRDEFDEWCLGGQADVTNPPNIRHASTQTLGRAEPMRVAAPIRVEAPSRVEPMRETASVEYSRPTYQTYTTISEPYVPVTEINRTVVVNRYDPYWPVVPLVFGGLLWASYHHGWYGGHGYYRPHRYHHGHRPVGPRHGHR